MNDTLPVTDTVVKTPNRFVRFIRFPLVRIVVGIFWVTGFLAITESMTKLLPAWITPFAPLLLAIGSCFGYYTFVRVVERRSAVELTAKGSLTEWAMGAAVGALLLTTTIGILFALNIYTVTGTNGWSVAVPVLMAAVMSGTVEELLIRGLVFRITEEWLGSWLALLLSALLFGAMHLPNPNATIVSAAAISLEAGVMLAAAYMLTRKLWLAIGIHMAWNFMQSGVFGVATSGVVEKGYLQSKLTGPAMLSGGEFGAEGSIVAVVICISAGVVLLWLAHRKGNFMRPRWRRVAHIASQ